jgi:DNA-binding response OmpR family regulator
MALPSRSPAAAPAAVEAVAPSLESTVFELRTIFAEDARGRLAVMFDLLVRMAAGGPDVPLRLQQLSEQFHRLAGASGLYGYPAIALIGRRGEDECLSALNGHLPVAPQLPRWTQALEEVRMALGQPAQATLPRGAATVWATRLLVCADPQVYSPSAPGGDYQVQAVARPSALAEALEVAAAAAVVLVPGGAFNDTAETLREIRCHPHGEHATVLVLLDQLSALDRIELYQLGANRILGRDTPWEVLLTFATLSQPDLDAQQGRVFILEHDQRLGAQIRADLQVRGYHAACYWDLPALLAGWQERPADLLLVGHDSTGQPNWPVLASIRRRERLASLPVLVLIDGGDQATRDLVFQRGAEDYVPLPYLAEELGARVDLHVELRRGKRKLKLLSVRARPSALMVPEAAWDPRREAVFPGQDGGAPAPAAAGVPRLLLADDDPLVARLLEPRLRAEGWQVVRAADGEQAQRLMAECAFELVLLDLNLPFRNGFDLLQWLGQTGLKRRSRVAVLSAMNREEIIRRAFAMEADDFIPKPFNPEVVVTRLRRLLRK